jgi:hypothetical protein
VEKVQPPGFVLGEERRGELPRVLEAGWQRSLESGLVIYDPAGSDVEVVSVPPYRYRHLPKRASRPGARKPDRPPAEGLHLEHVHCPFDDDDFAAKRELAHIERQGRYYHVVANRYPVTPRHFLPVRARDAPATQLRQHFHGPEEIEDLVLLLDILGAPYHVYFNSTQGADGSQSGSSVNHWHGQVFPLPGALEQPLFTAKPRELRTEESLLVGRIDDWAAHHVTIDADPRKRRALAHVLWREVQEVQNRNWAFNFEAALYPDGRMRAFLFPRRPAPAAVVREVEAVASVHSETGAGARAGAGVWSANFGGWELTGDLVVPTRQLLDWIRAKPAEANALTARRLEESTRPPPRG